MLVLLISLVRTPVGEVTAVRFKSVERQKTLFFFIFQGPFHLPFFYFKGGYVSLPLLEVHEK